MFFCFWLLPFSKKKNQGIATSICKPTSPPTPLAAGHSPGTALLPTPCTASTSAPCLRHGKLCEKAVWCSPLCCLLHRLLRWRQGIAQAPLCGCTGKRSSPLCGGQRSRLARHPQSGLLCSAEWEKKFPLRKWGGKTFW